MSIRVTPPDLPLELAKILLRFVSYCVNRAARTFYLDVDQIKELKEYRNDLEQAIEDAQA